MATNRPTTTGGLGMQVLEQMLEPYHQFSTPSQRAERREAIAATAEEVNTATARQAERGQAILEGSDDRYAQIGRIHDEIESALEAQYVANQSRNDLLAKASELEAKKNAKAVEVYQERVNSEEARERFRRTTKKHTERIDRFNEIEERSQNGNLWERMLAGLQRPMALQRVQETQYNLDALNRQRLTATDLFAQQLQDNRNIARAAIAQDLVVHEAQAQAAATTIEHYMERRNNLSETVSSLGHQFGLDNQAVASLHTKLKALQDQDIFDAQLATTALNREYQAMQVRIMEENLKDKETRQQTLETMEPVWQTYIEATGIKDQIGDLSYADFMNLSNEERNAMGFYEEFAMFAQGTVRTATTPYSGAMNRMRAGIDLTPADEVNLQVADRAVETYNAAQTAIFKEGLTPDQVKALDRGDETLATQLQARLLDPNNPEDWAAIDNEVRKIFQQGEYDNTVMFESGAIHYGNVADMAASPDFQEMFEANVPEDILQMAADGEFQEIDTRMSNFEDAQRVQRESLNLLIDRYTINATGPLARQTDWAAVERDLNGMSKYLAANFKTQREIVQRTQFPLLQGTKIRMPKVDGQGTELVDLENPGAVYTRLRLDLIKRRAERARMSDPANISQFGRRGPAPNRGE